MTPEFPYVDLSAVDENKFYRLDGHLMTGSELFAYLEANEPANSDKLMIEPVVELDRKILNGEQPQ